MVSIKHKVTLKTKTTQEVTPAAVESPVVTLKRKQAETAPVAENAAATLNEKQPEVAPETKPEVKPKPIPVPPEPIKKSNTGKVVGGIAAAVAILAGVYFIGIKGDNNIVDEGGASTEQIAQVDKTAQPEGTQQSDATANNESETSVPVEVRETLADSENSNSSSAEKTENGKADKSSSNEVSTAKAIQSVPQKQNATSTTTVVSSSEPISDDVVENAKRVIRGDFGNGKERKDKLGAAYAEIQSKVNEMYRQGLVH